MNLQRMSSFFEISGLLQAGARLLASDRRPRAHGAGALGRLQMRAAMFFLAPHGRRAVVLAKYAAWVCILVITILSLVPGAERPHTGISGRIEHFIAYAGTGVIWQIAYLPFPRRVLGWIGLAAASCFFEALQQFVPGRSPSVFDAMASTAGLTFGMILGAALTARLTGGKTRIGRRRPM